MKRIEIFEDGIYLTVLCDNERAGLLLSRRPFKESDAADVQSLPLIRTDGEFEPSAPRVSDTGNMTGRRVVITQNDSRACVCLSTVIQFHRGKGFAEVFSELSNYGLLTVRAVNGDGCFSAAAGQTVRIPFRCIKEDEI